jgi:hypothetical protein
MNHPSEATLALYAGRDLGFVAQWRTGRHLAGCGRCRSEVEVYAELREALPELGALPDLHWNRLAAEMKANIRLGLAAGECVRESRAASHGRSLFGSRALVSYASIAALLVASLLLERPVPKVSRANSAEVVLRGTSGGIELKEGGRTLSLLHRRATDVTVMVDAQGSVNSRYVDAETGYVTINNIYAQ